MKVYFKSSVDTYKWLLQKSNHDLYEKYPYVRVGTLVSMRTTDILTKNSCCLSCSVLEYKKRHMMMLRFSKEIKMIIVIDKWLHSLNKDISIQRWGGKNSWKFAIQFKFAILLFFCLQGPFGKRICLVYLFLSGFFLFYCSRNKFIHFGRK